MRKKVKNDKTPGGVGKTGPKASRRPASRAALRKRLSSFLEFFARRLLGSLGYGIWWIDRLLRSDSGPIDLTGPGIPFHRSVFTPTVCSRPIGSTIGLALCEDVP